MRHRNRPPTFSAALAIVGMLVALMTASTTSANPLTRRHTQPPPPRAAKNKAHRRCRRETPRRCRGRAKERRGLRRKTKRSSIGNAEAVTHASVASASSDLLFKATHLNEFWLSHSAPGAITEVPDPNGSGESAFQMTVGDHDVYPITPTENPRAELLSPSTIEPEDEIWWSSKFYLPPDFPSSVPGWLTLMEGPYGSPFDGTPPWHIEVCGEHIQWSRNGTYNWDVPWQMPLVKGSWVTVMVHEKFATDGWVEMWVNGQPITFFDSGTYNPNHVNPTTQLAMETMDRSNNGGTNSIYLMSYRKVGMFNSVTLDEGPLEIGTTRASVEA